MDETTTDLFDALRRNGVERLRFSRTPTGVRRVAARPDANWEDAAALLPESSASIEAVARLVRDGGHERLDLVFRDPPGLRFVCAVHSTAHGPGAGGLRRRDLVTPEFDVILDALDLSRAMSCKNTVAEVGRGGSKLVVHGSPIPDYGRELWLRTLAEEIDLSGTITGPDVGFPKALYADLGRLSGNVSGYRSGGTGDSAGFGVALAVHAALAALGKTAADAKVAIQGMGGIGGHLARTLAAEGSKLVVTDIDHGRIDDVLAAMTPEERRLVGIVAPYQIQDVECDLLAPCAIGGVVDDRNVRSLRCRAIAGGANNQLRAHSLADELRLAHELHAVGVLYVPDWIASAGGTIHGTMEAKDGDAFDAKKCHARIRRVCGWLVDELLDTAKRSGRAPLEIAADRFLR